MGIFLLPLIAGTNVGTAHDLHQYQRSEMDGCAISVGAEAPRNFDWDRRFSEYDRTNPCFVFSNPE